jgi:putative alpha-1,2-mannosidase
MDIAKILTRGLSGLSYDFYKASRRINKFPGSFRPRGNLLSIPNTVDVKLSSTYDPEKLERYLINLINHKYAF